MSQELNRRTRDDLETAFGPRPASWTTQFHEDDASYRVEARIDAARRIATRAVDTITDTYEYINARAGSDPALTHQLRRIQETVAMCTSELIARYLGHGQWNR